MGDGVDGRARVIEQTIASYLDIVDHPDGDGSDLYAHSVRPHGYDIPAHAFYLVDGDLDITALAQAVSASLETQPVQVSEEQDTDDQSDYEIHHLWWVSCNWCDYTTPQNDEPRSGTSEIVAHMRAAHPESVKDWT